MIDIFVSPPTVALAPPQAEEWMDGAICTQVDLDIFFARTKGEHYKDARQVCGVCDVVNECLIYTLTTEEGKERFGFAAGMSPQERQSMFGKRVSE